VVLDYLIIIIIIIIITSPAPHQAQDAQLGWRPSYHYQHHYQHHQQQQHD
jgi:hypothetical protein